ncbi:hypothetical protein GPJ56_000939 [Histomonas meleagridis]|uniref:uncharacterized protein n=1 Tax=Histomonas meleagridis TaxID=135588 RepID=UPI00355A7B80|nr:hypothetical protein GPJ56_000939 [Histomonas meleagridis]KAH0803774.1 hypothetical protein GO595_002604 [Histomonas meleagridis]
MAENNNETANNDANITIKVKWNGCTNPAEVSVSKDITGEALKDIVTDLTTIPISKLKVLVKGSVLKPKDKLSSISDVKDGTAVYLVESFDLPPFEEEEEEEEIEDPKDKNGEEEKEFVPEPEVELPEDPNFTDVENFQRMVLNMQKLISRFGVASANLQYNMDNVEVAPANKALKQYIELWEKEGHKFEEYRNKLLEFQSKAYSTFKSDPAQNQTKENDKPEDVNNDTTVIDTPIPEQNEPTENNVTEETRQIEEIPETCLTEEELRLVEEDKTIIANLQNKPLFGIDYEIGRTNKHYYFLR